MCVEHLGTAGVLILGGGGAGHGSALLAQAASPLPGRLSVRPREMATGTRTERAGEQTLDSLPGVLAYVPRQCVGTRRCPLVALVHGGGGSAREEVDNERPLADQYGMIVVASDATDAQTIDAELQRLLRKFAIDPDRIALAGGSTGGGETLFYGRRNLDVFSRIAPLQIAGTVHDTISSGQSGGPQNTTTQFFISAAIGAGGELLQNAIDDAQRERRAGHAVKLVLGLHRHSRPLDEHAYLWRWLRDSWAAPDSTAQPGTLPSAALLDARAASKMVAFWISLMTGPDSIRVTARQAYRKDVPLLVGPEPFWVYGMVDVPTLAARYPSVAAALEAAGLTAQEEEAYRTALISARATEMIAYAAAPASVLGKNVAFLSGHQAVAQALEDLIGVPRDR